ncbi:ATP-binding protein [Streptomyces sp. bgisy154]|uniref:ATP-binding protein n=1 Tax=Streptomyces sp. bgisy154 TaxID=3413794 RepID=UPI003D721025
MHELDGSDAAPSQARRLVRKSLTAWKAPAECIDDTLVIVSELTTNAVRHTTSKRISLQLIGRPGEIEVAVRDSGPRPQIPLVPSDPARWSPNGRGLGIVQTLAARWGAEPEPGSGLRVWAVLKREGPA